MKGGVKQSQDSLGNTNLVFPTADILAEIQTTYEAGRTLDAYRRATALGEFRYWRGTEALLLASRITSQTGGSRYSDCLDLRV